MAEIKDTKETTAVSKPDSEFVGSQQKMTIGGRTYKVDLVFYHRILKCFVLIDLKKGEVQHEDIGQINFYLNYCICRIESNWRLNSAALCLIRVRMMANVQTNR